jgi:hypothetical protein
VIPSQIETVLFTENRSTGVSLDLARREVGAYGEDSGEGQSFAIGRYDIIFLIKEQ